MQWWSHKHENARGIRTRQRGSGHLHRLTTLSLDARGTYFWVCGAHTSPSGNSPADRFVRSLETVLVGDGDARRILSQANVVIISRAKLLSLSPVAYLLVYSPTLFLTTATLACFELASVWCSFLISPPFTSPPQVCPSGELRSLPACLWPELPDQWEELWRITWSERYWRRGRQRQCRD